MCVYLCEQRLDCNKQTSSKAGKETWVIYLSKYVKLQHFLLLHHFQLECWATPRSPFPSLFLQSFHYDFSKYRGFMHISLVFSNPVKKPLIRQQGKGRAGWSDIRQDDVSANVNQNALVCWQLKRSEGSSSRIKIPDPALKPLKSEMMPLSVEACSLWLGIKKGFSAAADKGFKRVTGIIHKSVKPSTFSYKPFWIIYW